MICCDKKYKYGAKNGYGRVYNLLFLFGIIHKKDSENYDLLRFLDGIRD